MPVYDFGGFTLDSRERQLRRGDERVHLTAKVFDTLELLVEARGRVVDRETFQSRLWPDTTVEDRNLTVNLSTLRKALGGTEGEFIATVPKRGYRIAVPVTVREESKREEKRTWTRRRVRFAFVSGLLAGLVGLGAMSFRLAWTDRDLGTTSLAVLPFTTIGLAEDEEYLSLGLADALTTELGSFRGLAVRSPATVSERRRRARSGCRRTTTRGWTSAPAPPATVC